MWVSSGITMAYKNNLVNQFLTVISQFLTLLVFQADENSTNNYTLKDRHSMNMSYLQSLPPNSLVVLDENDQGPMF
jgi:hypothetical protein